MIEESKRSNHIHPPLNTTFISLIPKIDIPQSFEDFRPISLCNVIYKVIAKIITKRIKPFLSASISKERFGFLDGRQIHEAIGVPQEGLHSMKTKKLKGVVVKIDLSKAYDRVNWLFIRLLLTHLLFEVHFINWVMGCISSTSFVVLINGLASPFFHDERGLRQGFPLSPMFFSLVVEGLGRALADGKVRGLFHGIPITHTLVLTHLLFVDDVHILCNGQRDDVETL